MPLADRVKHVVANRFLPHANLTARSYLERAQGEAATLAGELARVVAERDELVGRAAAERDEAVRQARQGLVASEAALAELRRIVADRDTMLRGLERLVAQRDAAYQDLQRQAAEREDSARRLVSGRDEAVRLARQESASLVAERDELGQVVAKQEASVHELQQEISERDERIQELQRAVAERDGALKVFQWDADERAGGFNSPDIFGPKPAQALLPELFDANAEAVPSDLTAAYADLDRSLASSDRSWQGNEADLLYKALERVVRGPESLISQKQAAYLPHLRIPKQNLQYPIVDVGCGRGEFLSLLRERGLQCVGVDTNAAAIDALTEQGYEVRRAGAVEYLRELDDNSLAAVVAFQVVEHLESDYLRELLKLAYAKLADKGLLLLETVNPYCLETYRSYYLDPTHRNPVPKDLLTIMLKFYRFGDLKAFYSDPVEQTAPADRQTWIQRYQTYALLGMKELESPDRAADTASA